MHYFKRIREREGERGRERDSGRERGLKAALSAIWSMTSLGRLFEDLTSIKNVVRQRTRRETDSDRKTGGKGGKGGTYRDTELNYLPICIYFVRQRQACI